jgi:hypothetical protein
MEKISAHHMHCSRRKRHSLTLRLRLANFPNPFPFSPLFRLVSNFEPSPVTVKVKHHTTPRDVRRSVAHHITGKEIIGLVVNLFSIERSVCYNHRCNPSSSFPIQVSDAFPFLAHKRFWVLTESSTCRRIFST